MTKDIEVCSAYVMPATFSAAEKIGGGVFAMDGTPVESALHVRALHAQTHIPGPFDRDAAAAAPSVEEPCLYGGVLFNHFGHFLLESIGRLWASHSDEGLDRRIVFLPLWGKRDLNDAVDFISVTLRQFDIDPARILLLEAPTHFAQLMIPIDYWGFLRMSGSDPRMHAMLARAGAKAADRGMRAKGRSIYVSRSLLEPLLGALAGEQAFEQYMRLQGYEIIHPERLTFSEQLACYRSAERLVFAEGSAIHSCTLLWGLPAKIAVISRRSHHNVATALFFKALKFDVEIIDCVKGQFAFGLPDCYGVSLVDWAAVSEQLLKAGMVKSTFGTWPPYAERFAKQSCARYLVAAKRHPKFVAREAEQLDEKISSTLSAPTPRRETAIEPNPPMTIAARRINALAKQLGGERYLEIGVYKGDTFRHIDMPRRTAVDPAFAFDTAALANAETRFVAKTSNDFFRSEPYSPPYDIVFIDGLHAFAQVVRDLANAVLYTHPKSAILIDNVLPSDVYSSLPDPKMTFKFRKMAHDGDNTAWHGDVYKIVYYIHDFWPNLNFRTIVGSGNPQTLVWRSNGAARTPLFDDFERISRLTYFDLHQNYGALQPASEAEAIALCLREIRAAP